MTSKISKPSSTRAPEQRKPRTASDPEQKPWMKHAGKLKHLHKEIVQINKRVEEAFENIDQEKWGPADKRLNSDSSVKVSRRARRSKPRL